jgi:hypothetical protein
MRHPNHSPHWHALTRYYSQEADSGIKVQVLQWLIAYQPLDPTGRFLRATCLADLCADPAYLAEAVPLGLAQQPPEPERLLALALFHWGDTLRHGGSRAHFIEALQHAQLPLLVQGLGRWALDAIGPACPDAGRPDAGRPDASRPRVAVLAGGIGQTSHPPTLTALQQVRLLSEQGCEVALFSAQELSVPNMGWYLGNQGDFVMSSPLAAQLAALLPAGVACYLADPRLSLLRRWHDTGQQIAQFTPDLILFVGLFSPLAHALFDRYPVLGLCCHSMAPMAQLDLWLSAEARDTASRASDSLCGSLCDSPWAPLPSAPAQPHPWRVWLPKAGAAKTRADLGCTDQQLLLISVGGRLEREIDSDWGGQIGQLLLEHPNCVWLLLGGSGKLPPALAHLPPERLRLLPHQEPIRGILRCADIYLNPDRLGGGFSVAEAMAEGLPTLALADSDGGAKLGQHAVPDLPAYLTRLRALMVSAPLRQQIGQTLRAQFAATLDMSQSGPALLAACQRAQQLGQQRLLAG